MTVAGGQKRTLGVLCGVIGALALFGAWVREQRGERLLPALSSPLGQGSWQEALRSNQHDLFSSGPGEENPLAVMHTGSVTSVAFSPDGRLLASASTDRTVLLWGLRTKRPLRRLQGHTESVTTVAFSPDGTVLATGADDATVRLWDPRTGEPQQILTGHTQGVRAVAFSPDGATLAAGVADGTIRLWEMATGLLMRTLSGPSRAVTSVAFAANGSHIHAGLAAAKKQEALWQWDTTTGEHHWRFQEPETGSRDGAPRPLVSFSEGQTIAWGAGNKVILGNPQTHQVTATLEGHFEDVTALAFSPDGRYLASGAFDKTIVLWDLSTHEEIRTFYGHLLQVKSLAFSPDGRVLASAAADRTVRLWEPDTGHQIAILGTPPDGEEMWEFKVLSARREERLSALLNTWTTKAGRSFLLVTIRFKNKLEEPNLFYIPGGLAVSDGQETYPCKGLEMFGILEEGRYFRSYLEAESESSQTLIFVVPTTARGLTLRFLNLAPMVVN